MTTSERGVGVDSDGARPARPVCRVTLPDRGSIVREGESREEAEDAAIAAAEWALQMSG